MKRIVNFAATFYLRLFIGVIFFPGSLNAQSGSMVAESKKIDSLFSAWNTGTPGAAVLVSRDGKVIYEKAFGMADLEHGVINTPGTIFEAGSVSKQFTAAAVFLLIEEGKIGLKDDIRKYFPDFPDYGTPITVENLLHHTSGLRDWGSIISLSGWPRGTRTYTPAQVREIIWRQKALNFKPGQYYSYSNSNFNMLVFLVEKVSGMSHQAFTRQRIFLPAGMEHTQWRDNFREIVPDRAIAYSHAYRVYQQDMPFENTFGHGALLTTVDDLEKWNQRWANQKFGEQFNNLQRAKTKLNNGKEITYAGGVVVDSFRGSEEISHSGATAGYRAWLAYYPPEKLSVVYLSNDGSVNPVSKGRAIAALFLHESAPAEMVTEKPAGIKLADPSSLSRYAGMYLSVLGDDLQELLFLNDSLRFKDRSVALIPVAENTFNVDRFEISFPRKIGQPDQLLFRNPAGDTSTYFRVHPFSPDEKQLDEFAGQYYSPEADARVELKRTDRHLFVIRFGDVRTALYPTYTDAFRDHDYSAYHFLRDRKKHIVGFMVSVSRARNVLFTREN